MVLETFLIITMPLLAIWANGEANREMPYEDHHPNRPADESGDATCEAGDPESSA
ncbi:MAG: hypothetical protein QF754_18730 [Alphaproteobacteria bacterium]|nr:hypothetical protein [Alphaproteobacteria bacterium]